MAILCGKGGAFSSCAQLCCLREWDRCDCEGCLVKTPLVCSGSLALLFSWTSGFQSTLCKRNSCQNCVRYISLGFICRNYEWMIFTFLNSQKQQHENISLRKSHDSARKDHGWLPRFTQSSMGSWDFVYRSQLHCSWNASASKVKLCPYLAKASV